MDRGVTTARNVVLSRPLREVLVAALGEPLATEYVKVRRAEANAYADKDDAFELEQHFFKY